MENVEEKNKITPSQYFEHLKNAKKTITTDALKESYGVFMKLAEKYDALGQTKSLEKLTFLADTLQKEEKLIEMGITTYVYKDTVEDYIENVADQTVKIVELSRYMREIPDELVETVTKTKGLFNELYVVFTDYTGKEERKVEKERRDKDPILFGVFKNGTTVSDRFYFLGDWVDEYCDLTLDKMIEEYKNKKGVSPVNETKIPKDSEELINILKEYKERVEGKALILDSNNTKLSVGMYELDLSTKENKKKSFFDKVRSVLFKKG